MSRHHCSACRRPLPQEHRNGSTTAVQGHSPGAFRPNQTDRHYNDEPSPALNYPHSPSEIASAPSTDALCTYCGQVRPVASEDRLTAIGQLTTGITGLLVSAVIMVQQLSTIIGLYRVRQFSEVPLACLQFAVAIAFLGACVYLIQTSIRVAVQPFTRALRH